MGLRIQTNVQSVNAQRNLEISRAGQEKAMAELASGSRINKASDDAAGLAISDNLRAQIRGLVQAQRNANDGISLVQTAEGSLAEIADIFIRLRELAIQASSDTVGHEERDMLSKEYNALKDEVNRIAHATEFNGTRLVDGKGPADLDVQVGIRKSNPNDTAENPINRITLDLSQIDATQEGMGISGIDITEKDSALNTLQLVDDALIVLSKHRAKLGSFQNRLTSTSRNLSVAMENMSAAKSRIRDTDYAKSTADLTQSNILLQAGASVLVQANQVPELALSLLK